MASISQPRVLSLAALFALSAALTITVPVSCSDTRACTAALNAALSSCAGAASCDINLEAGEYIMEGAEYGRRVLINGMTAVSITGQGDSTVLVSNISSIFSVSGCTRLTFSSFAVDSERLPFTYGQVTASGARNSTVTFDATSTYRIELLRHPWLNRAQGIISYDPVKQRYAQGTDIYALDDPIAISYPSATGTAAQMSIAVGNLRVGDWVVVRHQTYAYNAFTVTNSKDIAWVNVTLWSVAGMGIYTDSCTGISIDGLRIAKKDGRPMSITADGVHFSNTRGGAITLRNSLFEGQGDDGLNAPTLFQWLLNVAPDGLSFQVGGRDSMNAIAPYLAAGDTAQFFHRETLLPLGTALVSRIIANTVELAPPGLPAGVSVYALVNDAAQYASSLQVTDCVFRNNRARGALLKSSNVYAARNVFDGCSGSAAKTETDGCYWMEGHPVVNWTFADNIVREVNYAAAATGGDVIIDNAVPVFAGGVPTNKCVPYALASVAGGAVQRGLNISGNTFTQISGAAAVDAFSTDGLELRGNIVSRVPGAVVPAADFVGNGVVGAVVEGNVCDGRACVSTGLGA